MKGVNSATVILFLLVLVITTAVQAQESAFLSADYWTSATVEDVNKAVRNGADVNAWTEDFLNTNVLMVAARNTHNPDVIERLIKLGADVNARDNLGMTVLWRSAHSANPDVIERLIRLGASVNARTKDSMTVLMTAAAGNPNPDVYDRLVKLGADIKAKSTKGETALMYAALNNRNPDVIDRLIKLGANIKETNKKGETALALAIKYNDNPDMGERLIKMDVTADANVINNTVVIVDTAETRATLEAEWLKFTVTDIDGNIYQTVTIGSQVWMAENLKVTHYRNGNRIPNVTDVTTWAGFAFGAYCEYSNYVGNVATYGRLYNWFTVNDGRNIAPVGWHVPSDAEWQTLVDYLGGGSVAGGKMKEAGATWSAPSNKKNRHWFVPNRGATNESGFSGLPGGMRFDIGYGDREGFNAIGTMGYFWSATEGNSSQAWFRSLDYNYSEVSRTCGNKHAGRSVRCVRD